MHEVAAMQRAIHAVLECLQKAGGKRVTNVQLMLGASGHFTADAAYQLFEALVKGTPAENASLTIEWLPATYLCVSCLHHFQSSEPSAQVTCPRCGEVALEIAHQNICFASAIDVIYDEEYETVNELVLLKARLTVRPISHTQHELWKALLPHEFS